MKILELEARNVQRLKAVRLELKNNQLVVVGGNNGQGKTSLLDCIQGAFDKRFISEMPVRQGAEKATVRIQTEQFTLIQTIGVDGKETVELRPAEGFESGETVAQLRKRLSSKLLDPLAFSLMKPAEQVEVLKSLISFDFSGNETYRKSVYDERTFVNRELRAKKAENEANPFEPTTPVDEVPFDTTEFSSIADRQVAKASLEANIKRGKERVSAIAAKLAELIEEKEKILSWISTNEPKLSEFGDLEALAEQAQRKHEELNQRNIRIRKNAEARKIYGEMKTLEAKANGLTTKIEILDEDKMAAIENAALPVDGLSFADETGVLFAGIPFAQLSGAERLKVSLAMGIALNPQLRVLLLRDGSLLDAENLKIVSEMAEEHKMQVWLERVGKGDECSIIIEDGEVSEDRTVKGETK